MTEKVIEALTNYRDILGQPQSHPQEVGRYQAPPTEVSQHQVRSEGSEPLSSNACISIYPSFSITNTAKPLRKGQLAHFHGQGSAGGQHPAAQPALGKEYMETIVKIKRKRKRKLGLVAQVLSLPLRRDWARKIIGSKPTWATEYVQGQPG